MALSAVLRDTWRHDGQNMDIRPGMKVPAPLSGLARRMRVRPGAQASGLPLQAGALPYRIGESGGLEVLLVTSRGGGRWIVPKGWPIADKSLAEAAAIEAFEEAGVRGVVEGEELGRFEHEKSQPVAEPMLCEIALFALKVEEELEDWPEREQRSRRWFTPDQAVDAVPSQQLGGLLRTFARRF